MYDFILAINGATRSGFIESGNCQNPGLIIVVQFILGSIQRSLIVPSPFKSSISIHIPTGSSHQAIAYGGGNSQSGARSLSMLFRDISLIYRLQVTSKCYHCFFFCKFCEFFFQKNLQFPIFLYTFPIALTFIRLSFSLVRAIFCVMTWKIPDIFVNLLF